MEEDSYVMPYLHLSDDIFDDNSKEMYVLIFDLP